MLCIFARERWCVGRYRGDCGERSRAMGCRCPVPPARTVNVLRNRDRCPEQCSKGNHRDGEQDTHQSAAQNTKLAGAKRSGQIS